MAGFGIYLAIIAGMILFNAVFAAYEIALASVKLSRLQTLEQQGRRGARAAVLMKKDVEASLASIQLAITLVGTIAGAAGGAGGIENFQPAIERSLGVSDETARVLALAIVVVPLTFTTIVIGELVPKLFALRNAEWICLVLSPLMYAFTRTVWPVVRLLEATAEGLVTVVERVWHSFRRPETRHEPIPLEEIRAAAAGARRAALIGTQEEQIIVAASRLRRRPVREIMIPLEEMVVLPRDISPAEALARAHIDMHTRYPVVAGREVPSVKHESPSESQNDGADQGTAPRDGSQRPSEPQFVGYVTFKDIVMALGMKQRPSTLEPILRPIPVFSDRDPLSVCLDRMIKDRTHIALIRDSRGKIVGMITLEDILEELIGEIEDEFDRMPTRCEYREESWLVGGGATLGQLKAAGVDLLSMYPESERAAREGMSLADWIEEQLGRAPRVGDTVDAGAYTVYVQRVRRRRVLEARITRNAAGERRGREPTASASKQAG